MHAVLLTGMSGAGESTAERAAVVRDTIAVEPRLRAAATHVIDTTAPPDAVVTAIVAAVS